MNAAIIAFLKDQTLWETHKMHTNLGVELFIL